MSPSSSNAINSWNSAEQPVPLTHVMLTPDALGRARLGQLLDHWTREGWLRPLDRAFANFLGQEVPDADPLALLAASLASHQLGRGHACLDLETTLRNPGFALSLPPEGAEIGNGEPPPHPATLLEGLTLTAWRATLGLPDLVTGGPGGTPLVLAGPRLYLRRYWEYERAVSTLIQTRLTSSPAEQEPLPIPALRQILDHLFPLTAIQPDWQKLACALAARAALSVITGGPGTGKTTTVVRLLALLQALAIDVPAPGKASRPLRIRLAAPTGKAAARLNEAIAGAVAGLPLAGLPQAEAVRASIPVTVTTLHRLLGSRPDTRRLRHHAGNPLALDVLVIDEASMIDLEMMAAVLAALPPKARLILLGDKDQLASVEAGAVLGQLCQRAAGGHYTPATRDWLAAVAGEGTIKGEGRISGFSEPPDQGTLVSNLTNTLAIPSLEDLVDPGGTALDQAIVMLRHSHRFAADSGIGQLAAAVNVGSIAAVRDLWARVHRDLALVIIANSADAASGHMDTAFRQLIILGRAPSPPTPNATVSGGLASAVVELGTVPPRVGYRHYLEVLRQQRPPEGAAVERYDDWARAVLAAQGQFQVLCALRRGPWGVAGLNEAIARLLREAGLIPSSHGWYLGRPVLVTRNDYALGLMNGDIGVTLARPAATGDPERLRVAFPAGDGHQGIKWVLPSRLQAVETVFALTVHKAQGSEFTHAALVLPDKPSPILTRELLYTGITRARLYFSLVRPGNEQVLEQAIERRVLRASGLLAKED